MDKTMVDHALPERRAEESKQSRVNTGALRKRLNEVKESVRSGRSSQAFQELALPQRYKGKGIIAGNKAHKRALSAVKDGRSLLLTGPCGNGKTHLAVALMQEWFADKMKITATGKVYPTFFPCFRSMPELLLLIKKSWDNREDWRAQSEADIIHKYGRMPFLVLDDLGAEKPSEWSRSVLYNIINRRYLDCLQTVITTNLTHEELAGFDDRIASRLCEMGETIDLGKKDWRVK